MPVRSRPVNANGTTANQGPRTTARACLLIDSSTNTTSIGMKKNSTLRPADRQYLRAQVSWAWARWPLTYRTLRGIRALGRAALASEGRLHAHALPPRPAPLQDAHVGDRRRGSTAQARQVPQAAQAPARARRVQNFAVPVRLMRRKISSRSAGKTAAATN